MFPKPQFYPGGFRRSAQYAKAATEKAQGVVCCYFAVPAGIYAEAIGKDYAIKLMY